MPAMDREARICFEFWGGRFQVVGVSEAGYVSVWQNLDADQKAAVLDGHGPQPDFRTDVRELGRLLDAANAVAVEFQKGTAQGAIGRLLSKKIT